MLSRSQLLAARSCDGSLEAFTRIQLGQTWVEPWKCGKRLRKKSGQNLSKAIVAYRCKTCCLLVKITNFTYKQHTLHASYIDFHVSSMSRPSHFPKHDACAAFLTALTLCCGLITELLFLDVMFGLAVTLPHCFRFYSTRALR